MTQVSHNNQAKTINRTKTKKLNTTKHVIFTHKQAIYIILATLVILNIILFSAVYKIQTLSSEQNVVIALNDPKTYNDITITASEIKTETGYIMGIAPAQDEKIISVKLDITNNSDSEFDFYPTNQTFIRDNQGSQFIMTPVGLTEPFAATTIAPNESKSGQLSFLVTNRVVPLFLYIESLQPSAGPFVIKLQ